MTLPNIITVGRLVLVPIVVWALLAGETAMAFVAFLVAGVSDGVDGFIARRFNQHSELGAYLDPIADKGLLVTTFVMLGILGELPLWLVVLAVSRDALIFAAVLLSSMLGHPVAITPLFVSKANTAVQILLALLSLASLAWFGPLPAIHSLLVPLSAGLTIASAIAYFLTWQRHMGESGLSGDPEPDAAFDRPAADLGEGVRRHADA